MNLRREATKTIWKTVVFAGAMLGSAGCHKTKAAPTTPPAAAADEAKPADGAATATDPATTDTPADPCASADPCGDRARGVSEDGEGDTGRGFLLS
ncbi:MAG: hypothetical protein K8W52_36655 [Deltaproteobacteria bacterium]|nr:hypothetical protein [Deltaproteobacteria bacterium]